MSIELVNEFEAAKYLGMSAKTLRASRCSGLPSPGVGDLPYVKMGRTVRYERSALEEFVAKSRVTPNLRD